MISSLVKNTVYSVLDILTMRKGIRRKINNSTLRFPPRWSRYFESDYESDNYAFLEQQLKPGMHVIDIGAHIGLFSVVASQLAGKNGKIVCIEPTPGSMAVLNKMLRLNHCENVFPTQAAVSDKEGTATFYISTIEGSNSNSLVKNKSVDEKKPYQVRLVTIDGLVSEFSLHPSIIKIDAEGAELDVLKGGLKTLRSLKPILILGLHPQFIINKGDSLEAIWELLESHDYNVSYQGRVIDKTSFCSKTDLFDVHCS